MNEAAGVGPPVSVVGAEWVAAVAVGFRGVNGGLTAPIYHSASYFYAV